MNTTLRFPKIFYGWWVIVAAFFISLYTGGTVIFGFTAFFEPIADEFGWSYTQISLASSLRGLEMGILAPLAGILVDRWGPRKLVFGGAIIATLGLFMFSRVTSIGMFYGAFGVMAIGMSACVSTVLVTAVNNWFRVKAGLVTGMALAGFSFGGLVIPLVVKLINLYDWRATVTILAFGMLVIVLPLSLLLRHRPEQYGLSPYGETKIEGAPNIEMSSSLNSEVDIGARQALKSRTFWHISLGFMFQFMSIAAVGTHVMPYLSSVGITRSVGTLVATTLPLVSVAGRISSGLLVDKFNSRIIAAVFLTMATLGLLSFGNITTTAVWLIIPFMLLFATSYGGITVLRASLTRHFFGRGRFGTLFGFQVGVMFLGGYLGPPLSGWVFDTWGSYRGIWFVFAGVSLLAMALIWTTPKVRAPDQSI